MKPAACWFATTALLLHAQPDALTTALLENRHSLAIHDDRFSGAAANILATAIAQSRFVLVGEWHDLAETPQFWRALCTAAAPAGFHTMAIEEGPVTTHELERFASQPDGQVRIAAFLKQYPESLNIYHSVEEFDMLRHCVASALPGDFHLWGLNQEALGGAGLLLDRILDTRPTGQSADTIRRLIQANKEATAKALETGKISDLYMLSADDKELAIAASQLSKGTAVEPLLLMQSLRESHEINKAWPRDGGRRNLLMRKLFTIDYADASQSAKTPPKLLMKFGSFHIYRGLNPVNENALGNYVAHFAATHRAQSLHISLMPAKGSSRMFAGPGRTSTKLRPFDLNDDPRSRYLQPILANLLPTDWTLFDLRPLRKIIHERPGATTPELQTLVEGIDILVMIPDATPTTPIQ